MKYLLLFLTFVSLYSCSSDETQITRIPPTLIFTDVFNFQVDTLDLDMISNTNENALFISYSANNGFNENVMKYNFATSSQSIMTHPDLSEGRQIEIIGSSIYSFAPSSVYKFDLSLGNPTQINTDFMGYGYLRTIPYNDKILIPEGYNNLVTYNTSTNTSLISIGSQSTGRMRADGEVYNDKYYAFGGSTGTRNYMPESFSDINIYDIQSNSFSQLNLPYTVFESFTSLYGNKIIVAGDKNSDGSGAFIGIFDPLTSSFNETPISLDLSNISIRSIAVLNNNLYVAYADFFSTMPSLITIKVAKAALP